MSYLNDRPLRFKQGQRVRDFTRPVDLALRQAPVYLFRHQVAELSATTRALAIGRRHFRVGAAIQQACRSGPTFAASRGRTVLRGRFGLVEVPSAQPVTRQSAAAHGGNTIRGWRRLTLSLPSS